MFVLLLFRGRDLPVNDGNINEMCRRQQAVTAAPLLLSQVVVVVVVVFSFEI